MKFCIDQLIRQCPVTREQVKTKKPYIFPGNGREIAFMSSAALKHVLDLALELPAAERAALAHDLLASLDGAADADAAESRETEIARRLDELQSGQVQTVSAEEVLRRIDERLRR